MNCKRLLITDREPPYNFALHYPEDKMKDTKREIPIFYACDEGFIKYAIVSLKSIIENASKSFKYSVTFLHSGISKEWMTEVFALENDEFKITFEDVSGYLESIKNKLPIRDYYTKTTYFRFFISEMFPGYDKAIYIDADTVVNGDISELFLTDIGDSYLGAAQDRVLLETDLFGEYAEKVVGVDRHNFFNAGMLLINCKKFREIKVLSKFIEYLSIYTFVVAQDEDYLNVICRDHVYWLDQRWNTLVYGEIPYPIEEAKIIHYIMTNKPWHYSECRFSSYFWEYAKKTRVYNQIKKELDSYTEEEKARDRASAERLITLAKSEIEREDNFLSIMKKRIDAERLRVIEDYEALEREGRFDLDVEQDPEATPLNDESFEYIRGGFIKGLKRRLAYALATSFVKKLMREGKFIIKDIIGLENLKELHTGAILTCNHFHPNDSFAIEYAFRKAKIKSKKLYRVIREGNFTSFSGFYGFLMRNCDTLPLSSSNRIMRKFIKATCDLLSAGELVLFYPEQSLWWNYRKPKPLKEGAFYFATRCNAPVLPCFITMQNAPHTDEFGYPVQEYTIHIGKPIYPDENASAKENIKYLMEENAKVWKQIYEDFYHIPLSYTAIQAQTT